MPACQVITVTFKAPPHLVERMDHAARTRLVSRSDIIRESLLRHLVPKPAEATR